jgi:heterodisulfide reductase subunit A-like polyferredoxin
VARDLRSTWKGEPIQPYLENLIEKVNSDKLIKVFMGTEVVNTTGSLGNFVTTLSSKDGGEVTIEHGATILATGGKEFKPKDYLYGEHPDILTHLEMDTLLTREDARIKNAKTVAFIQCVGSRNNENPFCSKVCCTHSLKTALALKTGNPRMRVYIIYRDIRSYGFREDLYKEARGKGIIFIRYDLDNPPKVVSLEHDQLKLTVTDHVLKLPVAIKPDLLILASGISPNENKDLFEKFKVPVNDEGFLVEAHAKLRPVDFASDGLFVAGLAHYPKPLEESIAQAKAAVARAVTIISKDSIMVGGVVAEVTPEKCAVCLTCVRACPYSIPHIHQDGYAVIEPSECHGCGVCVSECPGKAIKLNHFTDQQIMAKTDALFQKQYA